MSHGSASWMLPYPKDHWNWEHSCADWRRLRDIRDRGTTGPWHKFIRLCRVLKSTRAAYEITYTDQGTHLRALVQWTARP